MSQAAAATPIREEDGVRVHTVDPRDQADGFLYFDCPACPKYIQEGFLPGSDPQMLIHEDGDGCRLVIDTDPTGTEHRIIEVPRGAARLEDVVLRCMEDEDRMGDRLVARAAMVSDRMGDSR